MGIDVLPINPNNFVSDPTTVEARAYVQTVIVAEELGFQRLVVERDSVTVVKKSAITLDLWVDRGIKRRMLWRRKKNSGRR